VVVVVGSQDLSENIKHEEQQKARNRRQSSC
jgi:hypothetical protein